MNSVTFHEIDHWVSTIEPDVIEAKAVADSSSDRVRKVIMIFGGLRPLLVGVSMAPLIPTHWRAAVQLFIAALDALTADGVSGEFKAGKDL
jgi:hypothetical protein